MLDSEQSSNPQEAPSDPELERLKLELAKAEARKAIAAARKDELKRVGKC